MEQHPWKEQLREQQQYVANEQHQSESEHRSQQASGEQGSSQQQPEPQPGPSKVIERVTIGKRLANEAKAMKDSLRQIFDKRHHIPQPDTPRSKRLNAEQTRKKIQEIIEYDGTSESVDESCSEYEVDTSDEESITMIPDTPQRRKPAVKNSKRNIENEGEEMEDEVDEMDHDGQEMEHEGEEMEHEGEGMEIEQIEGAEAAHHGQEENGQPDEDVNDGRSRKRKRNQKEWKRAINKRLRNMGKGYSSKGKDGQLKHRAPRRMGPGCGPGCLYKCHESFPVADRDRLFEGYWGICCIDRQREFIARHVVDGKPKRVLQGKKKKSNEYFFEVNGDKKRVCKTFFAHTLAISKGAIDNAMSKKTNVSTIKKDQRGKHKKQKKVCEDIKENIRRHIRMFPTVPGHYVRQSSKRHYLETDVTSVSKMHRLYLEWCRENHYQAAKRWLYDDIFNYEFNLGFYKPKKDQCNVCGEYKIASDEKKATMQDRYEQHLRDKDIVQFNKKQAKERAERDDKFACATFDFQRILPCPIAQNSLFFYKHKLSVFNFTIYDLKGRDVTCYMWNEAEAGRGGNEVATCVRKYIEAVGQQRKKDIAFFSDGCGGQNKNRFVFCMYLHMVCKRHVRKITHYFLETGHTHNEGDSVHASIDREIKNVEIYKPEEYYRLVQKARKNGQPYIVKKMHYGDFLNYKGLATDNDMQFQWDKYQDGEKVKWSKVKVLQVDAAMPDVMKIKTEHDGNWKYVKVQQRNIQLRRKPSLHNTEPKQAYQSKRGISQRKYKDIVALVNKFVPAEHHDFYKTLPKYDQHIDSDSSSDDE